MSFKNNKLYRSFIAAGIAALMLILFSSTINAQFVDHDLALTSVYANPIDLECPTEICAHVLALGLQDYQLQSGEVTISFEYQFNGGSWQSIGEILNITWANSDGPLSIFDEWPGSDFPSGPNNCISFRPTQHGEYRFRATLQYPDRIVEDVTDNNSKESIVYSTARVCRIPIGEIQPCEIVYHSLSGIKKWRLYCPERDLRLDILAQECLLRDPPPPWCPNGIIIDVCQYLPPPCPDPGPWPYEVLFDNRINKFELALINEKGEMVARPKKLKRPVVEGGETFTMRLQFKPSDDETYYFALWPTEKTKRNEYLPLSIKARRVASKK